MNYENIEKIVTKVVENLNAARDLNLETANALIEKVKARAKEMGLNVVVAVADKGGNPISVQCMDNSYIASYDIAFNKAFTVVSLKMPTTKLKDLAQPGGSLYGIQFTNGGRIVIFGGGVPLYDKAGRLVGGLGVSGGSEGEDTELAEYGGKVFSEL